MRRKVGLDRGDYGALEDYDLFRSLARLLKAYEYSWIEDEGLLPRR